MSRVAYIRAWPRDPATGSAGLVAMAAGGSHLPYFLDGLHYRAGGVREPRFAAALGFDEKGWTGAAIPTVSVVEFAPGDPALLRAYATLYWKDAAIEVDAGEEYTGVGRILTGTIADAAVKDGKLLITVADFGVKLAKPAVQAWFKGTGGIEGDAVCEGRVKRRSYGYCANVEGRVLLAAYNIYEFGDPARGFQSFPVVRDMGREGPITILAWQGSIGATLDALKAAAVQQGGAVVAPSISCVKWWTQPAGPLTADIQGENTGGYVETAAQIAARILSAASGPAIVNLAAATALRPAVAGLHIGDDSETTAAALDRLLLPVSLMWRFGTTGQIDIREWGWGGDAEAVQGRFVERVKTLPPTVTRRLGYNRNHRQHSEGEIAADILAAGAAYADGTSIDQLRPAEAGANVTEARTSAAFSGQGSLATRNDVIFGSHITSLPAAIDPSNLINGQYVSAGFGRYLDGVTLQALRPGEGGANVTEGRVAAAIAGQGSFATLSSLGFGSPMLTGFGSLAGLGNLFFGSPYLLEGAGGAQATLAAFKTMLGIASGFSGQGALATLSSLAFGSSQLTGFGSLAGLGNLFFGSPYLLEGAGGAQATLPAFKTALGVAGGFLGQSPWATLSAPLTLVTAENPNLVYDGGLSLQGSKWTLGSGWTWRPGGNGEGPYFARNVDGGSVSYSDFFPWVGALSGYAQAEMFAGGMTAGDFRFDIEYFNGASLLSRSAQVGLTNGQLWGEVGTPFSSPAETTRARFRFFHSAGTTNSNSAIKRIKVSTATARTRFSDEATYGARYDNGVVMEALKPGEYGANVTEGRVSSGFAGQGALATLSSLGFGSPLLTGFGSLAGRSNVSLGFEKGLLNEGNTAWLTDSTVITQFGTAAAFVGQTPWATLGYSTIRISRLQEDGFAEAGILYKSGIGWLSDYWPQDVGSNRTEGRTAAAFAGQGALATMSSVGASRINSGNPDNIIPDADFMDMDWWRGGGGTASAIGGVEMDGGWSIGKKALVIPAGNIDFYSRYFTVEPGASYKVRVRLWCNDPSFSGNVGAFIHIPGIAWYSLKSGASDINDRFTAPTDTLNKEYIVRNPVDAINNANRQWQFRFVGNFAGPPLIMQISITRVSAMGDGLLTRADGLTRITEPMAITNQGVSAGFAGQTGWATLGVPTDRVSKIDNSGNIPAAGIYKPGVNWLNEVWPQEAGANVTEGRTAAAISGQTAWATFGATTNVVSRLQSDGYMESASIYSAQGSGGFLAQRWPQEGGANVTEGRTSAAIAGQGAFATQSWINSGNVASFFSYSAFRLEYNITRFDGTTIVTENMVITTQGVAAAIVGQGAGATANNLGQLDPGAKSILDGLAQGGPGSMTAGYGEVRSIAINAGAGRNIYGTVFVDGASNSQFGEIAATILWRLRGAGGWNTLASGPTAYVGPQEPGGTDITTTFTNNTGVNQVFEFMVTITRNGNAGGNVVSSRSYLSA